MPGPKSYHIFSGGGDSDFQHHGASSRRGGHGAPPAPEPLPEYRRVRTVFIHNMPPELAEKDLIRLAMPFGEIERVHYAWHMSGEKRGLPRGFATVEYKSVSVFTPSPASSLDRSLFVLTPSPCFSTAFHRDIACAEAAIAGINGQTHFSRTLRARAFTDDPSSLDDSAHGRSGAGAPGTRGSGPGSGAGAGAGAEGALASLPLRAKIAALAAHLRTLEAAEDVPPGGGGEERLVFPEQAAALDAAATASTAAAAAETDAGERGYSSGRGPSGDRGRHDRGRGYEDRGHSDRGRDDRGHGDRGHYDRGSDRGYGSDRDRERSYRASDREHDRGQGRDRARDCDREHDREHDRDRNRERGWDTGRRHDR